MMTQYKVNGLNYNVEVSGAGEPVLLLHGFTGDITTWHDVRHALETIYQVIALDIIGHGQTDKPTDITAYQMQFVADCIIKVLDRLSVGQVHLLGYSMGGRLALYLAIHYSDYFRSVILESASPGLATDKEREERRNHDNALADKIEANGIEWFVNFWETLPLWDSQKTFSVEILQLQRIQRLQNDPIGLANSLRGMGTGVQPSLWSDLAQLLPPTQLIVGELDTKFVAINQQMARNIPHANLSKIPSAGHTVHMEKTAEFIQQVHSFLIQII